MRIIAGTLRGKQLLMPDEKATRPFLELARGALFNILVSDVPGAAVLDLYAGSGALGLEALSRGAAHATFVERSPDAFATLSENIARCRLEARATALQADVSEALVRLDAQGPFHIIFCDPPFADSREWQAGGGTRIEMLATALLAENGVVAFRLEKDAEALPSWGGLSLWKDRSHGRSRLCLYR